MEETKHVSGDQKKAASLLEHMTGVDLLVVVNGREMNLSQYNDENAQQLRKFQVVKSAVRSVIYVVIRVNNGYIIVRVELRTSPRSFKFGWRKESESFFEWREESKSFKVDGKDLDDLEFSNMRIEEGQLVGEIIPEKVGSGDEYIVLDIWADTMKNIDTAISKIRKLMLLSEQTKVVPIEEEIVQWKLKKANKEAQDLIKQYFSTLVKLLHVNDDVYLCPLLRNCFDLVSLAHSVVSEVPQTDVGRRVSKSKMQHLASRGTVAEWENGHPNEQFWDQDMCVYQTCTQIKRANVAAGILANNNIFNSTTASKPAQRSITVASIGGGSCTDALGVIQYVITTFPHVKAIKVLLYDHVAATYEGYLKPLVQRYRKYCSLYGVMLTVEWVHLDLTSTSEFQELPTECDLCITSWVLWELRDQKSNWLEHYSKWMSSNSSSSFVFIDCVPNLFEKLFVGQFSQFQRCVGVATNAWLCLVPISLDKQMEELTV